MPKTLPTYEDIMLPLLQYLSDGKVHSLSESVDKMAKVFELSDTERAVLLPSGKYPVFRSRVSWAKTYLLKSELIETVKRAHFQIIDAGIKLLKENPQRIEKSVLINYSGYRKFTNKEMGDLDTDKWDIEGGLQQIKDFQKEWPAKRLQDLNLESYTNLDRATSFIYWLEVLTNKAGGISGGSAFKFIIFKRSNTKSQLDNPLYLTDGEYSWIRKYGETKEVVFDKVKSEILRIVEASLSGDFIAIEESIFGNAIKWKIAYLYNPESLVPIFKSEVIENACIAYGAEDLDTMSTGDKQKLLISHRPQDEYTLTFANILWDKYNRDSIYYLVEKFMSQSETTDLSTKGVYPKKYKGLNLNVSFGKGMPAQIPWMGFTDHNNSIQKGIYPIYLYYKEKGLLILSYGMSDSYDPDVNWPHEKLITSIEDYFLQEFDEAAPKYGNSYMHQVYTDIDIVSISELQKDLDEIIDTYHEIAYDEVEDLSEGENLGDKKMWMIAAGTKGIHWEEWLNNSSINIGWDSTGDLSSFSDQSEIAEKLREVYDSDSSQNNNAKACFQFAKEMKIGDYFIAKKGTKTIYGIGEITSEYLYSANRSEHKSYRRVNWLNTGNWKVERKIVLKTLTEISQYPEYYEEMLNLLLPDQIESSESHFDKYDFSDLDNDSFIDKASLEKLLQLLTHKKNLILQGPPGVGKTYIARRLAYAKMGAKDKSRVKLIQFHQSYAYEDFIQGLRPNEDGHFQLTNGVFYRFCETAKENPDRDYFFIIDEINRGNLSKIFGELMMLIEHDKRGEGFKISLTYSKQNQEFFIPKNLYIIGTMNTADRSLAMVDYALRRRFMFYYLLPQFGHKFKDHLNKNSVPSKMVDKLIERMTEINQTIKDDKDLGQGFMIGQSYFCNLSTDTEYDNWLSAIYDYEIIPLLEEYWYDRMNNINDIKERLLR